MWNFCKQLSLNYFWRHADLIYSDRRYLVQVGTAKTNSILLPVSFIIIPLLFGFPKAHHQFYSASLTIFKAIALSKMEYKYDPITCSRFTKTEKNFFTLPQIPVPVKFPSHYFVQYWFKTSLRAIDVEKQLLQPCNYQDSVQQIYAILAQQFQVFNIYQNLKHCKHRASEDWQRFLKQKVLTTKSWCSRGLLFSTTMILMSDLRYSPTHCIKKTLTVSFPQQMVVSSTRNNLYISHTLPFIACLCICKQSYVCWVFQQFSLVAWKLNGILLKSNAFRTSFWMQC